MMLVVEPMKMLISIMSIVNDFGDSCMSEEFNIQATKCYHLLEEA